MKKTVGTKPADNAEAIAKNVKTLTMMEANVTRLETNVTELKKNGTENAAEIEVLDSWKKIITNGLANLKVNIDQSATQRCTGDIAQTCTASCGHSTQTLLLCDLVADTGNTDPRVIFPTQQGASGLPECRV